MYDIEFSATDADSSRNDLLKSSTEPGERAKINFYQDQLSIQNSSTVENKKTSSSSETIRNLNDKVLSERSKNVSTTLD